MHVLGVWLGSDIAVVVAVKAVVAGVYREKGGITTMDDDNGGQKFPLDASASTAHKLSEGGLLAGVTTDRVNP